MNGKVNDYRVEEPAKVFFIGVKADEDSDSIAEKTELLIEKSDLLSITGENKFTAIKQHFGERGNKTFLSPPIAKKVISMIKKEKGFPVLVETNTLYVGDRSDSYHHLMLAYDHGFSIEKTGAPVVIMDGMNGQNQTPVAIPGVHFKEVSLASDIPFFDSIIVLSHVKGHMMSGMGGAIKNLGMGFASRAGKLTQHSDYKPEIKIHKCNMCGLCIKYCPAGALRKNADRIIVDKEVCIGCGECFTACKNEAMSFEWIGSDRAFHEKMAEYAFGSIINHPGRVGFINYFIDVTKQCDCWGEENPVIYENIGIFLSKDPVAVDKASYDMGKKVYGEDIFKVMWPELQTTVQFEHGERIGMGTCNYELINIRPD